MVLIILLEAFKTSHFRVRHLFPFFIYVATEQMSSTVIHLKEKKECELHIYREKCTIDSKQYDESYLNIIIQNNVKKYTS